MQNGVLDGATVLYDNAYLGCEKHQNMIFLKKIQL